MRLQFDTITWAEVKVISRPIYKEVGDSNWRRQAKEIEYSLILCLRFPSGASGQLVWSAHVPKVVTLSRAVPILEVQGDVHAHEQTTGWEMRDLDNDKYSATSAHYDESERGSFISVDELRQSVAMISMVTDDRRETGEGMQKMPT